MPYYLSPVHTLVSFINRGRAQRNGKLASMSDGTSERTADRAAAIASKVEAFVRNVVIPYEKDPRTGPHGPSDELVRELRVLARGAGVLTPHIPTAYACKRQAFGKALIEHEGVGFMLADNLIDLKQAELMVEW